MGQEQKADRRDRAERDDRDDGPKGDADAFVVHAQIHDPAKESPYYWNGP